MQRQAAALERARAVEDRRLAAQDRATAAREWAAAALQRARRVQDRATRVQERSRRAKNRLTDHPTSRRTLTSPLAQGAIVGRGRWMAAVVAQCRPVAPRRVATWAARSASWARAATQLGSQCEGT